MSNPFFSSTRQSCVFCQRIEAKEYDGTASGVAWFEPLNPVVPGHMLFVPWVHVIHAATNPEVTGNAFAQAALYGRQQTMHFNLITSAGRSATQTVMHLHVHYVPRHANDGLHLPWT